MSRLCFFAVLLLVTVTATPISAQQEEDADSSPEEAAAAMARALQDPLANIAAIMTDNDIHIGTGNGVATPVFQVQPVYSFNFSKFSLVTRAVVPIIGLAPGAKIPPVGEPAPETGSTTWGLGDTSFQMFVAPKSRGSWKWGVGPQLSLKTHTTGDLRGAGWGAGPVGVIVGGFGPNVSFAGILGQLWGQNGFSTTLIQPNVFYNFPGVPGLAIGYNGAITIDHSIEEGSKVQLPIGFVVGRTTDLGRGYGLDMSIGPYVYPVKPTGGPEWSLKFGLTLLMPR
ncbi:MAG: hypothetical protein GKS06_09815 [Acidobacteria bacterium]|nr:hypothetical protein [Acidobacteriota bacterium]